MLAIRRTPISSMGISDNWCGISQKMDNTQQNQDTELQKSVERELKGMKDQAQRKRKKKGK